MKRTKKTCNVCETEQYLFSKGMCLNCYKKEFPEKFEIKKTPLEKDVLYVIPKISIKQKDRNKKYLEIRAKYLQQSPICEVCKTHASEEIHHRAGRDGDNLFRHFLAVCRQCHEKIEMSPKWAKENNYSISRLN